MEILTDYLIFLLKVFTIALAITIPLLIVIGTSKSKNQTRGKLSITNLSDKFEEMGNAVKGSVMNQKELKKFNKETSKEKKKKDKAKDNDKDTDYLIQYPAYDYIGIHPPEKNYAISAFHAGQWGGNSHVDILGDNPFEATWVVGDNSDALMIAPHIDFPILEREIYFGLTPNMNYDVSYVININIH